MKKIKLFPLAIIILILSLIWEFAHSGLYNDLTGISKNTHLILAGFGDLFIIFLIFGIISIINKSFKWIKNPFKKDYLLIIIFGILIAIVIEVINLNLGRWAYTELMPVILGIGISPLIQLVITSVLGLIIFRKITL